MGFFSTTRKNEVMSFMKMYANGDKSEFRLPQTYVVCVSSFVVPILIQTHKITYAYIK